MSTLQSRNGRYQGCSGEKDGAKLPMLVSEGNCLKRVSQYKGELKAFVWEKWSSFFPSLPKSVPGLGLSLPPQFPFSWRKQPSRFEDVAQPESKAQPVFVPDHLNESHTYEHPEAKHSSSISLHPWPAVTFLLGYFVPRRPISVSVTCGERLPSAGGKLGLLL